MNLGQLKAEAREKLAPNVTYIDQKFKEVASWAEELLNAFWVEQQKDLDTIIEHTHTQTIQSVRERVEEELELSCLDDRLLGKSHEYLNGYNTSTEQWRAKRDDLLKDLEAPVEGDGV